MNKDKQITLPIGLKVVGVFLALSGFIEIVWPLFGFGPHHPEFTAQSDAYKLGAFFRNGLQGFAFLVFGIGILMRKSWARKGALIVLIIAAVCGGKAFAWGFAKGRPGVEILLVSYTIVFAWYSIWFYLIFKRSSKDALTK